MNRAVALGAPCCALAAVAGAYLGDAFGMLVPLTAAIAGGAVLGLFAVPRSGGAASSDIPAAMTVGETPVGTGEPAETKTEDPVDQTPPIPQGPAETHEVQLKLDLARSYLEMDEAGLAIPLLQEILETELAVAARLGSDVVRETR